MPVQRLTAQQAFQAMIHFLEDFYDRTESEDVGSLLSDLQLLEDQRPADPAAWEDWLKAIAKVVAGHPPVEV